MTTLESLIRIARNFTHEERKIVRRYITGTSTQPGKTTNKSLKLLELICADPKRNWTSAQLENELYGRNYPAAFDRLLKDLNKRVIEAMSLPVFIRVSNYPERIAAQLQFHRQYIKALVLFEAGDYDAADETLLSLMLITNEFELNAERIATVEFLMHVIRINGNVQVIENFKDVPQHSQQMLSLFASGQSVRERIDHGQIKEIHHLYSDLKWYAKECKSTRALYMLVGIDGKLADLRGDHKVAEKLFLEQLGYSKDKAMDEEFQAQVYADLAQNAIYLMKNNLARRYMDKAQKCRKKFKTTIAQLNKLKKDISGNS